MKNLKQIFTTLILFATILFVTNADGQGTWTQKTDFGGVARYWASGFSVGGYGYLGTGYNGSALNDVWKYDTAANAWTQVASYPGGGALYVTGFSIGNKGYFGCGWNFSGYKKDFWEYDPAGNSWTQKATFPGVARWGASGFGIGTKGYIGVGDASGNGTGDQTDFYEWDQSSNTWSQKASFIGAAVYGGVGFSIGTKGYIGTGYSNSTGSHSEFYEYDQGTNTWTQKANFGGAPRYQDIGFSIGTKGYIGSGSGGSDFWAWDQNTNTWTQQTNYPGSAGEVCVGFSIGTKGFVGTGQPTTKQFWEFDGPCTPPVPVITPSGATTFCQGGSVTLDAGSWTSYLWSNSATTESINATNSGTYTVTVTNSSGCTGTASQSVTVNPNPTPTITQNGNILDAGVFSSYFWNNGATTETIDITLNGTYSVTVTNGSGCTGTASIVVSGLTCNATAYITNSGNNTVSVVDVATNTVTATIPVGTNPEGVSVSQDGTKVYVTNQNDNTVSVINTATNSVTATIPVGTFPIGISASSDGSKVYVINDGDYSVSVITTATNTVTATITVGVSPPGLVVSPDGTKVYVASEIDNTVKIINTSTNTVTGSITVGIQPYGITISPDGTKVYVVNNGDYTVSVINTSTNTVSATIPVGINPFGIAVSPDGTKVYVANYNAGTVTVINATNNTVSATIPVGNAWGVSVSPDGTKVYAANDNLAGTVSVIDVLTNTVSATITGFNYPKAFGNFINCNPCSVLSPVITANGPTTFCQGGSVTLDAGTWTSYLWSNSATTESINASTSGTYTVTITNGNGCTGTASQVVTVVVPDITTGLIAEYDFNGNANDVTGNGNNGVVSGATLTTDRFGNANKAYSFDGNSKIQLIMPSQYAPSASNYYSFSLWFNKSSDATSKMILQYMAGTNNNVSNYDILSCHSSCNAGTIAVQNYPFYNPSACSPDIINIGSWTHICVIFDQVGQTFQLYKNGVYWFSGPIGNLPPYSGYLTIGNNSSGAFGFFGKIDDIRIYNRALTSCDVDSLYNMPNPCSLFSPVITANGPTTFCPGGSVTLDAGTWTSYLWSNNATTETINVTTSGTYTVTVTNSNGCTGTASQIVYVGPDITTGLMAQYDFTGNANDMSGNGNNGTVNGATLTSDRFGNPNSAYNFNGTGQNITVPNFNINTQALTVSFWVNPSSLASAQRLISHDWNNTGAFTCTLDKQSGPPPIDNPMTVIRDASNAQIHSWSSTSVLTGTWYYYVFIYDGANINVYINNTLEASTPSATIKNVIATLYLGGDGLAMNGVLDDIRIYNRVLTSCDLDSLYNMPNPCSLLSPVITPSGPTTFCQGNSVTLDAGSWTSYLWSNNATTESISASTSGTYTVTVTNGSGCTGTASQVVTVVVPDINSGLVARYDFTGNANDLSGLNNNGTVIGATLTTDRFGNPNSAYSFNGSTDYINVGDPINNSLDFLGGPYSISAWVKTSQSSYAPVVTKQNPFSANESGDYNLDIDVNGHYARIGAGFGSGNGEARSSINAVNDNTWHHIVSVYTQNTLDIYVDGILSDGLSIGIGTAPNTLANSPQPLLIGKGWQGYLFNGTIDDVRIYNRALSSCDIDSLYDMVSPCSLLSPVITANGPTTFCQGGSVSLDAGSWTSYLWSNNATTEIINATTSGTYTVTVTNNSGCTGTASQVVSVVAVDITTGLIAQYDFNGNANDISGNGNNGIVNGPTLTADRFGNPNRAYHFNGINGQSNIAINAIEFNNYVNSGFTLSYWFTMEDSSNVGNRHFMFTNYDGINGMQIEYDPSTNGSLRHSLRTNNANPPQIDYYYPVSIYNTWKHAVLVWSPPNMISYVNGIEVNSQSNPGINNLSVCCGIVTQFGSEWNGNVPHLGCLDDIRIYNRALAPCDIDSLYNMSNPCSLLSPVITANGPTTFCQGGSVTLDAGSWISYLWSNSATTQTINATSSGTYTVTVTNNSGCTGTASQVVTVVVPDITTGLVAQYDFTGNANDISGNGHNGTVYGATLTTDRFGNPNSAYLFNGANDTIILSLMQQNITDYSISAWFKTSQGGPVLSGSGAASGNPVGLTLDVEKLSYAGLNTGKIMYRADGAAIALGPMTNRNTYIDNNWHHVVGVFSAPPGAISPGEFSIYVDDSLVSTTPDFTGSATSPINNSPQNILIGAHQNWSGAVFAGTLDDIRIYNRALTSCDVDSLYNMTSPCSLLSPVITANVDTTFCQGGSVTLDAGSWTSYLWSNAATTEAIDVSTSGTYTVTVTNGSGCTGTASQVVTVNTPALITNCTGNVIQGNDLNQCEAIVNYSAPTVSGNPVPTITYSQNSGTSFSVGTTTVLVTASNSCGISTCSFTVTVNDVQPPTINCPSNVTINNIPGLCTGTTSLTTPSFSDNCSDTGVVTSTNTITFEAWVYPNGEQVSAAGIIFNRHGGNANGINFGYVDQSKIGYHWNNDPNTFNWTGGPIYTPNAWNHVALVIEPTKATVYLNGVPYVNNYANPVISLDSATILGKDPVNTIRHFNGTMDEVRIWNYALSQAEIIATMNTALTGNEPGLINYYNFDEGIANGTNTGVTTLNAVRGNNGTLNNFALTGSTSNWVTGEINNGLNFDGNDDYVDIGTLNFNTHVLTLTNNSLSTYPVGNTIVTWTATDAGGNTATCNQIVTVVDNEAPVITCPSNITQGNCSSVVTFTVNATDNCSVTIVSSPASGSIFNVGTTTVISTATDASGNTATCSFTVTVPSVTPVITTIGDTTFCQGGSVTFDAGSWASYLWSNSATTESIIVSTSGTYTVTVTNGSGCTGTDSKIVTVNPSPTATITPNGPTTFCQGGSVILTASANSSYLWSTGATTQSITVSTSGSYTVTVTNGNGCSAISSATTVTVNPSPTATITPNGPTTFCQGGSVILTASANSSYLWSTIATTQSITVSTSGSYTVTVTNGNGCTAISSAITVTVNPSPTATITPNGPTTFCQGGSVILTASANSSYIWSTGTTTQSITVSTSGSYTVTVTNGNGCTTISSATTVTVNPSPTATITPNGPTTFCQGGSVVLTSSANSSYIWSTGATTQSITVSTSGSYTVTVTNGNGCTAISSATTVTINPSPTATITPSGPTTFCLGGSVILTASANSSYIWSTGATTQSITVSTSGSYTVTVTNGNGCTAISSATIVTVNPSPTATITQNGPTTFCLGGSVILTASANSSYIWSTGATTQSITVSTSGSYTVIVTNGNGCSAISSATTVTVNPSPTATITPNGPTTFCQGGSVVLTSSANSSYLWSTGATTQSITVSTSGSYTVTVTNGNGCTAISSATTVTINPSPTATITPSGPTTFCQGGSVVLIASANSSYLWSTGATTQSITVSTSGNYTVTVTNGNGCTAVSSETIVTVNPSPTAIITPSGITTFCQGDSVTLTATSNSSYLWSTGATIQSINVLTSGNYTVTVTNGNGCTAVSSLITVTVIPKPTADITPNGPTTFCQGDSVILTATSNSLYLWSTGATTQSITVLSSGTFTVTVTNGIGCTEVSLQTIVTVNPAPTASITASGPLTFCQGGSVTLTANVNNSYMWSNGQTTQSITVTTGNIYTVTVTNSSGCTATSSTTVTVTSGINPLITFDGALYFCQGDSVILIAGNYSSYSWNTGATTDSIIVNTSGIYTVSVTNNAGCTGAASRTVTVYPLPVVSFTGLPDSVCSYSGNYMLTGTPPGGGYFGAGINGNIFNPANAPFGNNVITYYYTNAEGCYASTTHIVFVGLCTGIPVIANDANGFNVYPNPADDHIIVAFSSKDGSDYSVKLVDMLGRTIKEDFGKAVYGVNSLTIDLIGIAKGMYMVVLQKGDVTSKAKLVIK